jgi:hypothetical protein
MDSRFRVIENKTNHILEKQVLMYIKKVDKEVKRLSFYTTISSLLTFTSFLLLWVIPFETNEFYRTFIVGFAIVSATAFITSLATLKNMRELRKAHFGFLHYLVKKDSQNFTGK